MALIRYSTLGSNKFILSMIYNPSSYLVQNIENFDNICDVASIATKGVNLIDVISTHSPSSEIVLVTFKDGSKIYCTYSLGEDGEVSGIIVSKYSIILNYKSASNVVTRIKNIGIVIYKGNKDGRIVNYPLYLFAGVDDATKTGYMGQITCNPSRYYSPDPIMGAVSVQHYYDDPTFLYNILTGNGTEYDPDPWSNGGYGDIGGGNGEVNLTSDTITIPSLPTSFSETGFIQMFCPTLAQIKQLSAYMWSSSLLDNLLKLFNDPMNILISLSIVPFSVPISGSRLVYAGNVVTTVSMDYTSQQYIIIDCGSIDVKNFYNAYIDYEPYTSCEIFLPYIGYQKLSMDDIMGKRINVTYRVDLMTGLCSAYITCNNILLYTFSGACSSSIPVSSQSYNSLAQSVISIATSTALAVKPAKSGSIPANSNYSNDMTKFVAASSLASNVLSCKPDIQRSGSVSSNVGMLGAQKPYFIFSVPRTCLPKGQNKFLGYPAFISVNLSTLTGFTVIEEIRLNNLTCTEIEKEEIMQLLKGGVIL